MSKSFISECYPTLIEAHTRIAFLEIELENAAAELQKAHPVGEVKGIGLREVAIATKEICAELARVREERNSLREVAEALIEWDTDGGPEIEDRQSGLKLGRVVSMARLSLKTAPGGATP